MEDKSKFDELLISYLSNELNGDDETFVLEWINYNDENKRYFEQFKQVWNLIAIKQAADNIEVEDEWEHFKTAIDKKTKKSPLYSDPRGILNNGLKNEQQKTQHSIYKAVIITGIAASVLLAMGFAFVWFVSNTGKAPLSIVSNKKTNTAFLVRHEKNFSGKPKQLKLEDGSEIILSDKSEVAYPEPFIANTRDITLKGRAYFKVAKDKTRPFTVISGDISTTALGTEFRVTAFESEKHILVKLCEGKVVVKSLNNGKKNLMKDFYLLPGQEFVYDKVYMTGRIKSPRKISKVPSKGIPMMVPEKDNPSIPQLGPESWYMFNNQPLEQVFKQLEELFKVKIVYSKKDISKIYFISTFRNSDSIDSIITQIVRLNNLKVTKKKDKFIITK